MKIVYVVESMELSGGVKDVVEQAEGLSRRGHEVVIVTKHARQGWIEVSVPVVEVPVFDAVTLPDADVHVATWFPTVVPALRARRAMAVFHFCQGYEALYPNCFHRLDEVEEAYAQPIPKLLLSAHLAGVLARFPGEMLPLGPAIKVSQYSPREAKEGPATPPTVGVVGPFELSIKGIDVALRAVARLKKERGVRLLRASQLPQSEAERAVCAADRYACGASVHEMVSWYHECDLLIHGSWPEEGLGLPPFEAMAAGVPVVVTDIPSLAVLPDAAVSRVAAGDEVAMAREGAGILSDAASWRRRRQEGLEAVREFDLERVLDRLEGYFSAALSGTRVISR